MARRIRALAFMHGSQSGRLLLLSCLTVQIARAEGTPQDRAQELFNEGLRLMQSDHCQEAITFFIASQQSDPAAATLANTATCYARIGKTGSAYSTYKLAASAAIFENKPALQMRTDQAAAALAPTLTQLRVLPLGGGDPPEIRINGELVQDLRKPIPLDPGENVIEATAPGHATWRRILSADVGTLMVVEVPDLKSLNEAPKAQSWMSPQGPRALGQRSARTDLEPYALIAGGVGVLAIGIGTAFTLSALSKQNSSNSYCDGRLCTQPGIELRDEALDRARVATWTMGFGVASLGAAAALWFVSPNHRHETPGRSPSPWVSVAQSAAVVGFEGRL